MDKKSLSERDICTKFITPAIQQAGWDIQKQVREEVSFTKGRIIVRGKLHSRGEAKRADYVLYHQPSVPIAVIEAKDNKHSLGAGMQQAQGYADALDVPFVFSSNGDGFLFHDRTGTGAQLETELSLQQFPSPDELWQRYCQWKGLEGESREKVEAPYYDDGSGRLFVVEQAGQHGRGELGVDVRLQARHRVEGVPAGGLQHVLDPLLAEARIGEGVQVHAVRIAQRVGADGDVVLDFGNRRQVEVGPVSRF